MAEITVDLDAQIEEILDHITWWQLPPDSIDELEQLLTEMTVEGLNVEAARIEALRLGLDVPPFIALAWDLRDARVDRLIKTHTAEAVRNVNNGTKYYLRQLIKEGVAEGLGTTEMVARIQRDLFGLPATEASKFSCPDCGEIVIWRCSKCREFRRPFRCPNCGFEGP